MENKNSSHFIQRKETWWDGFYVERIILKPENGEIPRVSSDLRATHLCSA